MSIHYLVYDIESIVDKNLLNRVCYAGSDLSDEEAYRFHVAELLKKDGKTFVNAAFHIPVCLAVVAVEKDFSIQRIGLLGEGKRTPGAIVRHFWDMYNKGNFTLVDFNGRGYDIRLMELWAFRQGLSIHYKHFDKFGVRYRYSDDKQLDLHECLTNNLSIRYQGGLNLFAKLLGKPGKMETKGDQVQELHETGKFFEIEDYCLGDAMDTYFIFLRWKLMRGSLSLEQEKELVDRAVEKMRAYSTESGYLKGYLANFGYWAPSE
jgi:predicted PolB exonuclease-like 3'-5' exonuclease